MSGGSVAVPHSGALLRWSAQRKWWLAAVLALILLPHVPGLDGNFGRSLLSQMGIAAVFASTIRP